VDIQLGYEYSVYNHQLTCWLYCYKIFLKLKLNFLFNQQMFSVLGLITYLNDNQFIQAGY
jgi:hypothetical protein